MKYNININQVKCQEHGLNFSQGAVMDALLSLSTRATQFKQVEGSIYYRLTTGKLVEELPVISDKKDTFLRIIKSLVDKGLLDRYIDGNITYYNLTEIGKSFNRGTEKNPQVLGKISYASTEKNPNNNNTINNTTINNNINNISKISKTSTQISTNSADEDKKPLFQNKGERFEEFWKSFPHTSGRSSKKDSLDSYRRSDYTEDEIHFEKDLLVLKLKYGLIELGYIPASERRINKLTKTQGIVLDKITKHLVFAHMKNPKKTREDGELLASVFGKDTFHAYVREYSNEFNTIKFNLT